MIDYTAKAMKDHIRYALLSQAEHLYFSIGIHNGGPELASRMVGIELDHTPNGDLSWFEPEEDWFRKINVEAAEVWDWACTCLDLVCLDRVLSDSEQDELATHAELLKQFYDGLPRVALNGSATDLRPMLHQADSWPRRFLRECELRLEREGYFALDRTKALVAAAFQGVDQTGTRH